MLTWAWACQWQLYTKLNLIYDKFTMIYALWAHIFPRCPESKPIKRATAKKYKEKRKNRISPSRIIQFRYSVQKVKKRVYWTMEMLNLSLKLQLKRHCFAALEPQIRILFCERFLSFYVNRVLCSRLQPTLLVVSFFRLTKIRSAKTGCIQYMPNRPLTHTFSCI